jgi:hypothetical protein
MLQSASGRNDIMEQVGGHRVEQEHQPDREDGSDPGPARTALAGAIVQQLLLAQPAADRTAPSHPQEHPDGTQDPGRTARSRGGGRGRGHGMDGCPTGPGPGPAAETEAWEVSFRNTSSRLAWPLAERSSCSGPCATTVP